MSGPTLSNNCGREALRRVEVLTLDLIFKALTSEQLSEFLKAPLELAAAKGNRGLAQRLVRTGAQVGDALHEAVGGGHGQIANDLLKIGASVTAKDKKGRTPLHVAVVYGRSKMVHLLLLKGADKDALDDKQLTPLVVAAFDGNMSTTQALLAAGTDVSLRYGELRSPAIHVAAEEGHVDILRAVIEHGAGVDAVDLHQRTALHLAASNRKVRRAIDVLLGAGANVDARDSDGWTPLHFASYYLSHSSLLRLLKHGAAVNMRDQLLDTPLMAAASKAGAYYRAANVVDSLLRAGADESTCNDEGCKAVDVVGQSVEEEVRRVEDVERVRELLANAPADRAWRRRGYLVLCRAHPDRMQHNQMMVSGTHHTETAQRTHSLGELARAGVIAEDSTVDAGRWRLDFCGCVEGAFVAGGGHIPDDRGVPVETVS